MNPTATPWHVTKRTRIHDSQSRLIAETASEDARVIVQCVNSHDALVEQLTLAHRMLSQTDWRHEDDAMNEIIAALALAGSK
jgi:hypothetical protein